MNGACTNPDPAVVCHAAAAVKKCLEVTKQLGGANFVMWGGKHLPASPCISLHLLGLPCQTDPHWRMPS